MDGILQWSLQQIVGIDHNRAKGALFPDNVFGLYELKVIGEEGPDSLDFFFFLYNIVYAESEKK